MKWLTIITLLISVSARAHILNYKNINTVAALVCKSIQTDTAKGEVVSKFKQDKTQINSKAFEIELTGTCNAVVKSTQGKVELESLGNELSLKFSTQNSIAQGRVGFYEIKVEFSESQISSIEITDTLLGGKKKLNLDKAQWSPNNMIFTTQPIKLISGKDSIEERNSELYVGKDSKLFNLWNFESFSCSQDKSKTNCSQLISII